MDTERGLLRRWFDSDLWHSFIASRLTVLAAAVTLLFVLSAALAPLFAPQDPFDPGALNLLDAFTPPLWYPDGQLPFLLGTDDQGRDIFSTILYGSRISLLVGVGAMLMAMAIGVGLGLVSGYVGGALDNFIMRVADVTLSFPALLVAMLINGVVRGVFPNVTHDESALFVLIFSIGISSWPPFARTVRGSTMVERGKEYVQAARIIGRSPAAIMVQHVLPNVMGPVLVIATIGLAISILTEASLSFLGVGMPPTTPSLGTLIRIGNNFLFSGEWWMVVFPGVALAVLILAVNLLGDWLRDALNPKLR
jgi:peptide/nickel transport system permease protein